jgi:hypothetical protein
MCPSGGGCLLRGSGPWPAGSLPDRRQSLLPPPHGIHTMADHVPTVSELLADTAIGNGFHRWAVEGGSIEITTNDLRRALEAAYDSSMPAWDLLVDVDDIAD